MTPDPTDRSRRSPEFDPRRSDEIRHLLTNHVAEAARPRTARLSRPMFALAATAALLFAGGVGAGIAVAHDRLTVSTNAQSAADSVAPASAAVEAMSGFTASVDLADLVPVLIVDGEVGYAHQDALDTADVLGDAFRPRSESADADASAGLVPIYRADGVTLLGHYDPAAFIPE
jgi:hypothetical protein